MFALVLLLPGLVYLRGTCAVYLALSGDRDDGDHDGNHDGDAGVDDRAEDRAGPPSPS